MTSAFTSNRPLNIIIAPNSFKGSLASREVAAAMQLGIKRVWPEVRCKLLAMADGGEGTLDTVTNALGGVIKTINLPRPLSEKDSELAHYGVLPDGTGVIEVADLVGLHQRAQPVEKRTSAAVGFLLRHCLDNGMRRFLIGLGGSGTNDAGAGLLSALGLRYRDVHGRLVDATPANLGSIFEIDFSGLGSSA